MKMFEKFSFKNFHLSLRTQLILFFTIFSIGVLTIGSYITYISTMNIIEKQNKNLLLQQFRQSDFNIRNIMNEAERLLKVFILDANVEQFLQTNNNDQTFETVDMQKNILKRIFDYEVNYPYISSIYFFTENRNELGRNSKNIIVVRNKEKNVEFFSSDLYVRIKDSYPQIVWEGGYREKFFNPDILDGDGFLISAAKEVTSLQDYTRKTLLVFNISESYLSSMYAGISQTGSMYVVNGEGMIISSGNGKNIGTHNPIIKDIRDNIGLHKDQKDNGSFTLNRDNGTIQIVYYKLKDTDWYLIGEIPLRLYSGDIAVIQKMLVFVLLSSIFVIFAVSYLWLRKITKPLNILAGKMHDMSSGKLGLTFSHIPRNEFGTVIKRFNEMSLSIVDLLKKNEVMQEEKRKLEIEALQYQINPHFIYNTLNMIKWMAIISKSNNIIESIVSLGNILKPAFKSMDKMCSLNEEIDYIRNYLKIMNWRFGNGITVGFAIPESLIDCKVPRFILQPVVENSITHGMNRQSNSICINIEAFSENGELLVVVADNGTGMTEDKVKEINESLSGMENGSAEGSIGLYNVNRRIYLSFGEKAGIMLESREGEGTRVTLKLPVIT